MKAEMIIPDDPDIRITMKQSEVSALMLYLNNLTVSSKGWNAGRPGRIARELYYTLQATKTSEMDSRDL